MIILSSVSDWVTGGVVNSIKFLGLQEAQALDTTVPASTSARNISDTRAQFLDNDGNPIFNENNQPMLKPQDVDPAAITDIGSALLQYGIANPSAAATTAVIAAENLALFRQGGAWDFQRVGPVTSDGTGTFDGAFTDFANVEIGAYGASIGMSLDELLSISNKYAEYFSKFAPGVQMNPLYPYLRNTNVWDITEGYSLYQDGKIGHH
jgi:hypothetical protein